VSRCEVVVVTWNGEDTGERDCGQPACAIVNGFPVCEGCREDYIREGLVDHEEKIH
jgi:hypothetical protein